MSGVMDTLISGIVKSAMNEILKKTGVKPSTTSKRTKRKTRSTSSTSTTSSRSGKRKAGPVSGSSGRGSRSTTSAPAKKQVSKRRTNIGRSKAKRRGY